MFFFCDEKNPQPLLEGVYEVNHTRVRIDGHQC